ncbi:MAG: DNA mismatch repair protein MutS, partial [Polyangiales bacterium]
MAGARVKGTKSKTKAKKKKTYTPVMLQFLAAKEAHPDSLLFFRLGDFYEMFFEDAYRAAELLGITQTFRGTDPNGERIAMAGVPHHAAAGYITRALKQGQKVAICEQMADPSTVKGVVPREVVRVITPALCLEDDALDAGEDNYLVALHAAEDSFGLAAFEMSTGNLRACSLPDHAAIIAELARLSPREVLFPLEGLEVLYEALEAGGGRAVLRRESHDMEGVLEEALGDEETVLEGPARQAAALALAYARKNLAGGALQVQRVGHYDPRSHLV